MSIAGEPHVLIIESSGLGDRSYVVHDGSNALVIDPQRDIDRVEKLVAEHGLHISHVVETHFHNDYVTGGLELARKHGATYFVPSGVDTGFAAETVHDGDSFRVGDLDVKVIHTPGHTPHHVSYAVSVGDGAGLVFTGGSMLYGTTGRPDLVAPDLAVKQAHDQWHSVRRLAADLPGDTAVYPTHGFGSFCSSTQAQGLSSTIENERSINPALVRGEQEFVDEVLANLDVFPAYYAHMGPANAGGPANVDLTPPELVDPFELRDRIARGEWVVDLRSRAVYAAAHVPGALNFDMDGAFVNYLAWMIPWGTPLTLLGSMPEQIQAAQRELVRVGIDRPAGQAVGPLENWLPDAADASTTPRITFHELAHEMDADPSAYVIDTRQVLDWERGHVKGAVFIPFYDIPDRLAQIPRDRPVFVYCGSGYRASFVASLLKNAGISQVVHVDDSFGNAAAAGLTIEAEQAPAREPGWTWIASRASVREYAGREGSAHAHR